MHKRNDKIEINPSISPSYGSNLIINVFHIHCIVGNATFCESEFCELQYILCFVLAKQHTLYFVGDGCM